VERRTKSGSDAMLPRFQTGNAGGLRRYWTNACQVPSPVVLEFGDAISGISRVPGQAARSIG
jgi:hypothetical protein